VVTMKSVVFQNVAPCLSCENDSNNTINRKSGFCLSKSWKPLICSLGKLSGNDARFTSLHGYTHSVAPTSRLSGAPELRILSFCSVHNSSF
jgi:hypothetical protein